MKYRTNNGQKIGIIIAISTQLVIVQDGKQVQYVLALVMLFPGKMMAIEIEQKAPFSCFPVCVKCEREGVCEKVWHSKTAVRSRVPAKVSRAAIEAIEDRRLAAAWYMSCGHSTDYDVQEAYRAWKPKGKDSFCEHCGAWKKNKPRSEHRALPDQPEF